MSNKQVHETVIAAVFGILIAMNTFGQTKQDYEQGGDFTRPHAGEGIGYMISNKDSSSADNSENKGPFKDLPISPISLKDAVDGKSVTLVLVKDFMRMENSGPSVKDVEFERYFPVIDEEQIVLGRWVTARTDDGQIIPISVAKVTPDSEGNLIHTWRLISFPEKCQVLVTVSSLVGRRERPLPVGKYSIPPPDKYPPTVQKFLKPTAMIASEHQEIKAIAEKLLQETKDPYVLAQNLAKIMKAKSYTAPADADLSNVPTAVAIQRWGGSCCGSAVSAIAILRACGIPAQITYCPGGYIHGITRFYIQDYGWIRMDSTCGVGKLPLVQEPEDLGLARFFDMPIGMESEWGNYAWPYYHNDTKGQYRFLVGGIANEKIAFAVKPAASEKDKGPAEGYVTEPYPHYEPGTWNLVLGSEPAAGLRQSWDKIAAASRKAMLEKKMGAFTEVVNQLPKADQYVEFVEKEIKMESGAVPGVSTNTFAMENRGIAILSSSIGTDYRVEDLAKLMEKGKFSPLVIDFAWITYHWDQTKFGEVNRLVESARNAGIPVAAMYRPRFLSDPTVPTQVDEKGRDDFKHGFEINYFDPDARKWGIEWGNKILAKCPGFDEVIIYNPRNFDTSKKTLELEKKNANARNDATWQFVREARQSWSTQKAGVRVGVAAMQNANFWKNGVDLIDSAYPFFCVRNDESLQDQLKEFNASRKILGGKMRAALTKVTWEEEHRISPAVFEQFHQITRSRKIPYLFWEFETLINTAKYTRSESARILSVTPDDLTAFAPDKAKQKTGCEPKNKASTTQKDVVLENSDIDSLLENIDNIPADEKNNFVNIEKLVKIAGQGESDTGKSIFQKARAIVENPAARANQRWMCCYVLSGIRDERAIPVLTKVLCADPDVTVRSVAACALGEFNSQEARAALEKAANSEKNAEVLGEIKKALGRQPADGSVSSSAAVPVLSLPPKEEKIEKLPWPHQAPGLTRKEVDKLNQDVWVINDFPLYQADEEGKSRYIHGGLDIVLDNGTKIYAMQDGWVKCTDHGSITIADAKGDEPSFGWGYAHLGNLQVHEGEFVKRGAYIGDINFDGLPHIHLTRKFSEGKYWKEDWHYETAPNAYFTYTDETPPVIKKPFYFFENNSEKMITAKVSGKTVVSGAVDIVVGMRDGGLFAHSKDSGFGDRLCPAKIVYEIKPMPGNGKPGTFKSFDFTTAAFKQGFFGDDYNTSMARTVFIHTDVIEKPENYDKTFSYYIITNTRGDGTPREITPGDAGNAWNTAAVDKKGNALYPNGEYEIRVRAEDFKGNSAKAAMTVIVKNVKPPADIGKGNR